LTVVQALIGAKSIQLTIADEEKLPPGVVKDGRIENPAAVIEAFKVLKKRAKLTAYIASINIPSHFCAIKEFDVPEGYFDDSNDNLAWEMGQHVNEIASLYKIKAVEAGEGNVGKRNLAVASRSVLVEERARLLTSFGLSPCAVEPDIIAAFNALSVIFLDFPSENFLIVDISAPYTSFGLASKGAFISGGYFRTPAEVISGDDGSFPLARALTQEFNKFFALHGFVLGKKGPEMMIACGRYAESFLASKTGNYMNLQVFDGDPFKSSWVDASKLKTTIPWARLIKPFGLAMRSPYD